MKSAIRCPWNLFAVLLWLLSISEATRAEQGTMPTPVQRVLILSGQGDHDWRTTSPFLRQLLQDTGRFDVRICESPAGITSETLTPFDLVVDDCSGHRLGNGAEKAIAAFVRSGKGLIVTHGGLSSFAGSEGKAKESIWPEFAKITKVSWPAGAAGNCNVPFRLFEIKADRPDHPVMEGIKALRTGDQPRQGFALLPGADVLATDDKGAPILFVSSYGKGRVFCTALGHDLGSMEEKTFISTFLRGAEWAASGKVTLPPDLGLPNPKPDAVRILVITGGHDHEGSFYGLFEGYKDIGWAPVSSSKMAFQNDLRTKYDVLVFYDFTRDMEDKEKKNLRDFVESGKGIVVLHHAVLNFQKWPWWYEEVVGGRYRLDREGGIPNSTVKFGEEELITPVGGHPITKGIGPFHVTDETYHGLYISPKIKPLLLSDNPTSDRTVGWIGPCETSRVVFIQLGHDHSPFRHPSYRALVHNSILWTAGRLN